MYWPLVRLQKQSRLLCDRTILHSEEQLWTITEDTEAPYLHETLHTTSSTQQRYMQIHENLQYPGVLINTKAAKTKQTTLWSNNFALRVAVMNHKWRYGSATHIYTKHRTLLAPHSNVICIIKKNSYIGVLIIIQAAKKTITCDRTILHFEQQLWTITEDTEAPHLHETSHTTSSTLQRYMQIHEKKLQYPGVLIITKAAKTKQTTRWSNNFALRGAVMNHNWRYGSATSTRSIAHY